MTSIKFENETCSRCNGSGHYSFNLRDGTTCWGCRGSGKKLSRRGIATRNYLHDLQTHDMADAVVGGFVYDELTRKWWEILAVDRYYDELNDGERIKLTTKRGSVHGAPGVTRRLVANKAELTASIEAAIEFQANATKAGKPRKQKLHTSR